MADGRRLNRGDIGPKAESLRALITAGLPVPEARFLSCDAYRGHAERAGVACEAGCVPLDPEFARAAIAATPLDAQLASLLDQWRAELGGGALAVRSSASAEDLPQASFAGQHDTVFVDAGDELGPAVVACWASLYSDRASDYRARQGIDRADVAMAVIVQRLVPARAAGVAFTVDPLDGTPNVVVEAVTGFGEMLVSGRVTPDRFVCDRFGALLNATPGAAGALSIPDAIALEVAGLAIAAETVVGAAADVEWAWDGEQVWLLQARPVTAISVQASAPSRGPASDDTTIWSNVNTGEILPDVVTPMTWSIVYLHANDIVGGMLDAFGLKIDAKRILGRVGGRVYFNLSMLRDAFAVLPFVKPDLLLGGMHTHADGLPSSTAGAPSRWAKFAQGLRTFTGLPAYVWRHTPKKALRFAARMRETTEAMEQGIAAVESPQQAASLIRELNDEFGEFNDSLAYQAVAMIGFGILGAMTKSWLGDETGALANRLVTGRGGVASADAGQAMWRLAAQAGQSPAVCDAIGAGGTWATTRAALEAETGEPGVAGFLAAWDAFMREHGHHRRGEFEFANPPWSETPDYVLGVVRGYLADERALDPLAAYEKRAAEADAAAAECLARLRSPLKRSVFRRALAWGRSSARTRENVKSEAVRWLVAMRHALLSLGDTLAERGVLERPDDIFFVDYGEIPALVADESTTDWRPIIAARRAEHVRLAALTPPSVVVGAWDERSSWEPRVTSSTLRGISVSAGIARGPARVFATVESNEAVLPGEILVAPFTDPGWTPYFVPAAGIVMDMGGLLSHGSIIAREYGIPAVVNVGPATRLIRTGQLIEVDGDAGEVRILG